MTDAPTHPARDLKLKTGDRIFVIQQIPRTDSTTTSRVEGTFVRFEQKKTGSWYAHGKDDKLWLDRLVLQKDDGEIVVCNLDQYSHLEKV